LNSNTLNVVAGLLIPGVILGLGPPSGQSVLITIWYAALTAIVLALAYRHRGLSRLAGGLIIAAYAAFTGSVLAIGYAAGAVPAMMASGLGVAAAVTLMTGFAIRRRGSA